MPGYFKYIAIVTLVIFHVNSSLLANDKACALTTHRSQKIELGADCVSGVICLQKKMAERLSSPEALNEYTKLVSRPSRYFSDLFGLFPITKVDKQQFLSDIVSRHARVLSENSDSLYLRFEDSYDVVVYFDVDLQLRGRSVENRFNVIWFEGKTPKEFLANIDRFQNLLARHSLSEKYLIRNPYEELQIEVESLRHSSRPPVELLPDSNLEKFRASAYAALVLPDKSHADITGWLQAKSILENESLDWLAIEMFTKEMQPELDSFIFAQENSPEFIRAASKLADAAWDARFQAEDPNKNPYMQLLEICRQKRIRVYGMDAKVETTLWVHGETVAGVGVRNQIWASVIPDSGRGLVFGGSMHFTALPKANVQDFLKLRRPTIELFTP